ncbi:MAG: hypothetical protein ACR5K9_01625 [Wolbachia sp.]
MSTNSNTSGSPSVLKALIEAGVSDSPSENYNGSTALDCATKMYSSCKLTRFKNCCEILIEHILEKSPNARMPSSVSKNEELAKCWNACKANNEG